MSEVYGSAPVLSLEEGAGVSMKRMIPSSGGPISGKGSSWTSPSVPSVPSAPSASTTSSSSKKKKRGSERVVGVKGEKGLEGVVDSEAYMDLVIFEKKLDSTIMRKRLDIQEALKRPVKQKTETSDLPF
ncbi:SMARCD [Lepeophtheirus salmonis]|uniref:SMARCD n=1 Tax=Lepeophtheirus salmonis TaxID=72036 RepID=A0A7R8CSS3_LEPSM|nr:SMARCD [Lepeophtheirus salmonis]CAF2919932.1 SMARCD [Lepeophtheirus salmonis]